MSEYVKCTIEHHAILFALLSKQAFETCRSEGQNAILAGTTRYGNERGRRMAANALAQGDELNTMTSQVYGEWQPDYEGQMDFGRLQTQPTLQTYISKCAWCDAWKKHDLLEYGKLYCVDIDNAVYQGFRSDFICTPTTAAMSWGGRRCEFDWGHPLNDAEVMILDQKKLLLGTSCIRDFNFHTAHLLWTISQTLQEFLPAFSDHIIEVALQNYINTFGKEYLDVLAGQYTPS